MIFFCDHFFLSLQIPKGFSYFAVHFGTRGGGFAYPIENESTFPDNFGREIVCGLVEIEDPFAAKKPRVDSLDEQSKKVVKFSQLYQSFDFTLD